MKIRCFLVLMMCLCLLCGAFGMFTFGAQAAAVKIITQPKSVTIGDGESGSFKVVAENVKSYQWQFYYNGWQQSSVVTANYGFRALMKFNGRKYRCILTGTDGDTVTTNEVVMTVKPVTITKHPVAQKVTIGSRAYFEVAADYAETYQWQWSEDGGSTWKDGSVVTNPYTSFTATAARNNRLYRCLVSGASSTATSNAVKFECTTHVGTLFTRLTYRKASTDKANTSQGMGMIKNNIYSAVILSKNSVEETYLYRTNINYPNSSKNLGQYDYLGHCNDLIAFSYGGKPYLLAAKDHHTVNLVCVANDEVVKQRTFTIGGSSGFGGVGLLSVNGSKVKLLIRGYPNTTGMTFGTCEFDMANLPANNDDIGFTNSFSVSFDSICTTIGNTIGYSDCLTIGTSVDGISQPGIYLTQSIAYDSENDRLYIPVMVLRKAKASDEKTSYKYGVFVVYNGVTTKLPGKTNVAVDDFFGYTDNYLEIQSAGFYNGLMYFSATVTHDPETWSRDCNFYTVPVKTTKITGNLNVGISAPSYGETPQSAAEITTGANNSCTSILWTPNDSSFKAGTVYSAKITLKADAEYSFDSNNISVPGASSVTGITYDSKTITFTATFPETVDLKLVESAVSDGYKLDEKGFYGFSSGTSVATVITLFKYDVTVRDKDGNIMTSGKIGTGCTISCAGKTATALLRADIDGDGEITANDYTKFKSMFKTSAVILDGVYKQMADVDKNGKYTVSDYLMIKRSVNGSFIIKNN